jgi:hypothetical protein
MEIVVAEILQDKIFLDASGQLRTVSDAPSAGGPPQLDLANLD